MSSHGGEGRCDVSSGFNHRKSQKRNDWGVGMGGRFNWNGFWLVMQMPSSIQEAQSLSHTQVEDTQLPPELRACGRGNSPRPLIITLRAENEIHQIANLIYDRSQWRLKALWWLIAAQKPQPGARAAGAVAVKQWRIPSRDVATYIESQLRISSELRLDLNSSSRKAASYRRWWEPGGKYRTAGCWLVRKESIPASHYLRDRVWRTPGIICWELSDPTATVSAGRVSHSHHADLILTYFTLPAQ